MVKLYDRAIPLFMIIHITYTDEQRSHFWGNFLKKIASIRGREEIFNIFFTNALYLQLIQRILLRGKKKAY